MWGLQAWGSLAQKGEVGTRFVTWEGGAEAPRLASPVSDCSSEAWR